MVEPKFEVFKDARGEYRFRLIAANGEIIAASQGYGEKASCLKGIESVKHNAVTGKIFDLVAGQESTAGSKFEIFKDTKGEYRYRLVAGNEEIIAASQGYDAKVSCIDGIESVKRNAAIAMIMDTTPTTARHKKISWWWNMLNRLVYSYFFRGMWWRDSITGSDFRDLYPYSE